MYATLEQMLARYDRPDSYELTQITAPAGGVLDEEAVEAALAEASGQMDLYIGSRHPLPLSGVSAAQATDLARIACDIARYRLYAHLATEEVRARYEEAIRVLEQIAAGRILLRVTSGAGASGQARATAAPRVMTRTGLGGVL